MPLRARFLMSVVTTASHDVFLGLFKQKKIFFQRSALVFHWEYHLRTGMGENEIEPGASQGQIISNGA